MDEVPRKARRRRFQFGIGTMFVLMTLFAAWLAWELRFIQHRSDVMKSARADRVMVVEAEDWDQLNAAAQSRFVRPATVPWWRRSLGDEAITAILFPPGTDESKMATLRTVFPEATVEVYPPAQRAAPGGIPIQFRW
jgi:hypothetical protein